MASFSKHSHELAQPATKDQKLCFNFSFAFGAKFLNGAKNSENARELDFLPDENFTISSSGSVSIKLQVLFVRRFLGGGFGGGLSKPLSTNDDEHELISLSVAIQMQFKTDQK